MKKGLEKINPKNKSESIINIASKLNGLSSGKYECMECGVLLALYPGIYDPMSRGPHYICPKCHEITDISLKKGMHSDEIQPIDISPPKFIFVGESKGNPIKPVKDYDPDPGEEERLRNLGATIIDKKIQVSRDY